MARALFAAVVALAAGSLGCDASALSCDRALEANPYIAYREGTVENGVYMSSPWDGELLYFPGGMHYAIEHQLGGEPRWITSYLSFDERGTAGGSVAQSAGNQVVILDVSETTIKLANDSCVDYWLLVTAGGAEEL